MDYQLRKATAQDKDAILNLFPRLADFDIPTNRNPKHLWESDAKMFLEWMAGSRPDVDVSVAVSDKKVIGVAIVSEQKELLSDEPSAHLEVLALEKSAEGFGVATALMNESDKLAKKRGAKSMTLHVFANNTKARALYERQGFDGELLRYIKPLD